jgi:hypothetical protein
MALRLLAADGSADVDGLQLLDSRNSALQRSNLSMCAEWRLRVSQYGRSKLNSEKQEEMQEVTTMH